MRNRDENSARRWPGPKPTPNDHSPSAATEIVAFSEAPRRPKPTRKSSLDWVMLQFDAEAPNLHVTAAHGYRTPKCSKPHAAYRRDRATTEAIALPLPPRGNPECPLSAPPKRPFQRSPQYRRAAEATRWWLPNTSAAEATVAPPHLFPSAEASERPMQLRDSTMRPRPTRRPASFHAPARPKPVVPVENPRDSPK